MVQMKKLRPRKTKECAHGYPPGKQQSQDSNQISVTQKMATHHSPEPSNARFGHSFCPWPGLAPGGVMEAKGTDFPLHLFLPRHQHAVCCEESQKAGARARARRQGPLGSSGAHRAVEQAGGNTGQDPVTPGPSWLCHQGAAGPSGGPPLPPASCCHEASSVRARTRRQVSDEQALLSPQGMSEYPFKKPASKGILILVAATY